MYVTAGKVINVRGLKGELKIFSTTDFAKKRYQKGNSVFLYNPKTEEREKITIQSFQQMSGFDYVLAAEIDSVEKANLYRGYLVQIARDDLGKLQKDEYYFFQLIGCQVFDSKQTLIGVVIEIMDNGAQKLLRVQKDDKTKLIPFIDHFLHTVDIAQKIIVVKEIEGLL